VRGKKLATITITITHPTTSSYRTMLCGGDKLKMQPPSRFFIQYKASHVKKAVTLHTSLPGSLAFSVADVCRWFHSGESTVKFK